MKCSCCGNNVNANDVIVIAHSVLTASYNCRSVANKSLSLYTIILLCQLGFLFHKCLLLANKYKDFTDLLVIRYIYTFNLRL